MDFIRWASGTDAESMSHVSPLVRVAGAVLLVLWLAWALVRPR